jgi:hypothetical protein
VACPCPQPCEAASSSAYVANQAKSGTRRSPATAVQRIPLVPLAGATHSADTQGHPGLLLADPLAPAVASSQTRKTFGPVRSEQCAKSPDLGLLVGRAEWLHSLVRLPPGDLLFRRLRRAWQRPLFSLARWCGMWVSSRRLHEDWRELGRSQSPMSQYPGTARPGRLVRQRC